MAIMQIFLAFWVCDLSVKNYRMILIKEKITYKVTTLGAVSHGFVSLLR